MISVIKTNSTNVLDSIIEQLESLGFDRYDDLSGWYDYTEFFVDTDENDFGFFNLEHFDTITVALTDLFKAISLFQLGVQEGDIINLLEEGS
jgi:hypothetical protein